MQREDKTQRMELIDRKELSLCGVENVESFDENSVAVNSVMGFCRIVGEDLKITKLDMEMGVINVSGTVDGVFYDDADAPQQSTDGFFARLFK